MAQSIRSGGYAPKEVGAEVRFTTAQLSFIGTVVIALLLIGVVFHFPLMLYLQLFVGIGTLFFVAMLIFSLVVVTSGIQPDSIITINEKELAQAAAYPELPFITIIVAAYKEAGVAQQLITNLKKLKYPGQRQVLIVLEQNDTKTIQAFHSLDMPSWFRVVVRPAGNGPMTKPGAMNFLFNNGYVHEKSELTVVFDAEDEPDENQLLKAVVAFFKGKKTDSKLACVQGRLTFEQNYRHNWLTRMLHLDYIQHFGLILPGLSRLRAISPLGGTSNYILTAVLRQLGGWDAFNVTEDLDLAVRLARNGYSVRVFDSVTKEEAVTTPLQFIKQRSRWIKGGVQTYLRHMRNPAQLYHELGFWRFVGFQCTIGAPLVLYAVNPIFWSMTLLYALTSSAFIQELYSPALFYAGTLCFVFGNFSYVYYLMVGAFRTKNYSSVVCALAAPIYWVLLSLAGYKAFWEFFASQKQAIKWDKTEHTGKVHNS